MQTPIYGSLYNYYPIKDVLQVENSDQWYITDFDDFKYVNTLPEEVQIRLLRVYGSNSFNYIKHIKNLTEEACIFALTEVKLPSGERPTRIGDIPHHIREKPAFLMRLIDVYEQKIVTECDRSFNKHISYYFKSCGQLEESVLLVLAKKDPVGFVKYLNEIATEKTILIAVESDPYAGGYLGINYAGGFQRGKEIWEKIAELPLTINDKFLKAFYDDMYAMYNIKKVDTEHIKELCDILTKLRTGIKLAIHANVLDSELINWLSTQLYQFSSKLSEMICSKCDKEVLVKILLEIITDVKNLTPITVVEEKQV